MDIRAINASFQTNNSVALFALIELKGSEIYVVMRAL
jgi:hypothetical protein